MDRLHVNTSGDSRCTLNHTLRCQFRSFEFIEDSISLLHPYLFISFFLSLFTEDRSQGKYIGRRRRARESSRYIRQVDVISRARGCRENKREWERERDDQGSSRSDEGFCRAREKYCEDRTGCRDVVDWLYLFEVQVNNPWYRYPPPPPPTLLLLLPISSVHVRFFFLFLFFFFSNFHRRMRTRHIYIYKVHS